MMGRDIGVMHRAAGWYERLGWYTLAIPAMAGMLIAGTAAAPIFPVPGVLIAAVPLVASYAFLARRFRNPITAIPRWAARWVLIWPYSWGILRGLVTRIPESARK